MPENDEITLLKGLEGDRETQTKAAFSTLGTEGEFPCLIVYSEKKHVGYIYPTLSQIENVLRDKRFKPLRLGDEIRSGEDYLNKLEKLIEDCVLGIVIFDGFRANVLFEYGFLKGRNKPTILLQSKNAFISVKTLYESLAISGLGEKGFDKLRNPPINHSFHFSDFSGKHVAYIKWNAREDDPLHPSKVLESELEKNQSAIIEEVTTLTTRNIPKTDPAAITELLTPLLNVIKFYVGAVNFDIDDLKTANNEMITTAKKYGFQLPYDLYSMIASTCLFKAKKADWRDVEERINCLSFSIEIYQEILKSVSIEKDPTEYSDAQKKIGEVYFEISKYQNKSENCKKAIKSLEEALKVYTLELFPMDYAMTQNNLGAAYGTLAEVEGKAENCKKAIKSYEDTLKVFKREGLFEICSLVESNLIGLRKFCKGK